MPFTSSLRVDPLEDVPLKPPQYWKIMDSRSIELIRRLSDLSSKPPSTGEQAENTRNEALQLSRKIVASLERPANVAVDLAFSPLIAVAARVAIDLNIFKHLVELGRPVTSQELASLSAAEELLIIRILRPLSSTGFVDEVDEKTWQATPVTEAMAIEAIAAGHRMVGEMMVGAARKAPQYFKESGYRCPTDPHDGLMQFAFQTKLSAFDYFSSRPSVFRDFNTFMGNTMGARGYWVDWFPVEGRLLNDDYDRNAALLVDVGAGKGHDLIAFHNKYPGLGRLVLQDLPNFIESMGQIDPAIELMGYDFFTEQPVKGARAYFFHHILHDWADDICLKILAQLKAAMKPGYSKLLLHEMILPERGAPTFHAVLDMTMMAFNGGMERTESQFQNLLERAGFQVIKFWPAPEQGGDGIVEAMLMV